MLVANTQAHIESLSEANANWHTNRVLHARAPDRPSVWLSVNIYNNKLAVMNKKTMSGHNSK